MDRDKIFELSEAPVMASRIEDATPTHRSPDEMDMARLGKKQVLKVSTILDRFQFASGLTFTTLRGTLASCQCWALAAL